METKRYTAGWPTLALALVLIAGLPAAPSASAQTLEDALLFSSRSPATGARMLGLAGAGTAGIADYGAFFNNPAGLGYFRQSSASGSINTFLVTDDALYRLPGFSNNLDEELSVTSIGNAAYLYSAPTRQGSFVIGAAYNQVNTFERDLFFRGQNDLNSITDFFMPLPGEFDVELDRGDDRQAGTEDDFFIVDFFRPLSEIAFEAFAIDFDEDLFLGGSDVPFRQAVRRGTVDQAGRLSEEGHMREVSLGGAVEGAPNIMVGVSANLTFGTYQFRQVFEEDDILDDNDGSGGTTDFSFLSLTNRFESDLIGINVRAGISADVGNNVRVGVTVESPTFYAIDEASDIVLETAFDNGDRFIYGDDFEEDAGRTAFEYEIMTPWRLGAGVSFTASDLTVYADAELVDWSQLEFDARQDEFFFDDLNVQVKETLEPVINTRIGAEYEISDLILRIGFAYQPDPRDDNRALLRESRVDRDKQFYSVGFGYRASNQFRFDFGWMQEHFDDQFLPYTEVNSAPVVDEEVIRNQFAVGVSFFF